jgi:hybrid cluster-associated redox disulfide protein
MSKVGITPDQTVGEIMRRWPGTVAVFLLHRMACVGCTMNRFDTLAYASAEYAVPLSRLVDELEAAAGSGDAPAAAL